MSAQPTVTGLGSDGRQPDPSEPHEPITAWDAMLDALVQAKRSATRIDPASWRPPHGVRKCYDLQRRAVLRRLPENADGSGIVGYKIGLSGVSARARLGVSVPVHGYLLGDSRVEAGRPIGQQLVAPRVEPEVAFIVGPNGVSADATFDELVRSDASLAPAIEIVDSRWDPGAPTVQHLIVDQVSAAAFAIGQPVPVGSVPLAGLRVQAQVGARRVTGNPDDVWGHPLESLRWLLAALEQRGERLRPGHTVLTGSWCTPIPAAAGDEVLVDFGDRLGVCATRFDR